MGLPEVERETETGRPRKGKEECYALICGVLQRPPGGGKFKTLSPDWGTGSGGESLGGEVWWGVLGHREHAPEGDWETLISSFSFTPDHGVDGLPFPCAPALMYCVAVGPKK